jgi:glycosyltransferase involved in cell wall biosynthesis
MLLEKANAISALWLTSRFHCNVLAEAGIPREKLKVLPSCVDARTNAAVEPIDLQTNRRFNFASMVQLSDDGLEVLLRAFAGQFRADEDVGLVLILRVPPAYTMEQLAAEVRRLIQLEVRTLPLQFPSVNLRVGSLPELQVAGLLAASQAYVEPRPSTWGRGVLEAMAAGVPVVGSRIGSNAELLNSGNSFTTASEITPESLGRLMRGAFAIPKETRRRGQRARVDVAIEHSPAAVGRRLCELIDELCATER